MAQEIVERQQVPPVRDRDYRTLDERLALRFPALAGVVRRCILGLPPHSRLRRAVITIADRKTHEAMNRKDWHVVLMNWEPDMRLRFVSDPAGALPAPDLAGEYQGHDAIRAALERFNDAWVDWQLDTGEIIDLGDRHVCLCRYHARGKASGIKVDHPVAHVITVRERRVVAMDFYWNQQQALEAAGLSE